MLIFPNGHRQLSNCGVVAFHLIFTVSQRWANKQKDLSLFNAIFISQMNNIQLALRDIYRQTMRSNQFECNENRTAISGSRVANYS